MHVTVRARMPTDASRMSHSPSSSPLRKKPRLSSPTYDTLFDELGVEEHQALDAIELSLSQKAYSSSPENAASSGSGGSPTLNPILDSGTLKRSSKNVDENFNPSRAGKKLDTSPKKLSAETSEKSRSTGISQATFLPVSMIVSAAGLRGDSERSPSPELPPKVDHDEWFAPSSIALPVAFASASALIGLSPNLKTPSFVSAQVKVSSVSPTQRVSPSWDLPSASALEKAQQKLKQWESEIEDEMNGLSDPDPKPAREPFKEVENAAIRPRQISHLPPPTFKAPMLPVRSTTPVTPTPAHPPSSILANPILARTSAGAEIGFTRPYLSAEQSNPATPARSASFAAPRPVARFTTPTGNASEVQSTPITSASTPEKMKPLGLTPRARAFTGSPARPKFVSPFKPGMRPGDPARAVLLEGLTAKSNVSSSTVQLNLRERDTANLLNILSNVTPIGKVYAQLSRPACRTLASSGLVPQTYDVEELEAMGVDITLLQVSNISHYLYYRFNPPGVTDHRTQHSLGVDTALAELHRKGYQLATNKWVENHWCLILWKMIGMACLEPEKYHRRWSWDEVMKQLEYRYNREYVGSSRPALRLITTQDASPMAPMVLCVSNISWTQEHVDAENQLIPAHPTLEMTDGWYRLRAEVDEALARAARKKILRVGHKIACCGVKLESSKKEPVEVLEAYGNVHLVLSGNSTHFAPWHARLGFHKAPWIATLGSLSPDGGSVPLLQLAVTQIYPIGFLEFIMTETGQILYEGPRTEKDEAAEDERWQNRRAQEAARLEEELGKKLQRLESYADKLDSLAGHEFIPLEDEQPPDGLENLVEELEEDDAPAQEILRGIQKQHASWLSFLLRQKCEVNRAQTREEITRDLNATFPPRRVRNFRILRVKDAMSMRKPSLRVAQLTVWDVMSLQITEGGAPGSFSIGQRYLVSNLVPSQQSAWMGFESGAEVYLSTTRNSRWRLIN